MKKYLRIAACIITLLLCAFFICSCESIDDMRARQGFYDEDGNVMLNGVKYIRIDAEVNVSGYRTNIYITESDVPVLLAEKYGDWCVITDNGEYISAYDSYCYCREDKYNELAEKYGGKIETNHLGIEYYDDDFQNHIYILTQEEQSAIEGVFENGEKISYTDDVIPGIDYIDCTGMCYYSEDMFFIDREIYFWIYQTEDRYYLSKEKGEYYDDRDYAYCTVPEEYYPLFDKLMSVDEEEAG